jgi:hypothetical protein
VDTEEFVARATPNSMDSDDSSVGEASLVEERAIEEVEDSDSDSDSSVIDDEHHQESFVQGVDFKDDEHEHLQAPKGPDSYADDSSAGSR